MQSNVIQQQQFLLQVRHILHYCLHLHSHTKHQLTHTVFQKQKKNIFFFLIKKIKIVAHGKEKKRKVLPFQVVE